MATWLSWSVFIIKGCQKTPPLLRPLPFTVAEDGVARIERSELVEADGLQRGDAAAADRVAPRGDGRFRLVPFAVQAAVHGQLQLQHLAELIVRKLLHAAG